MRHVSLVLARGCAAIAAGFGVIALIGWSFGNTHLSSFRADWIPMAPSTAVLLAFLGIAVVVCAGKPLTRLSYWAGIAVGSGCAIIGLLLFVLFYLGIRLDLEHIGFAIAGTVRGAVIGHMSPLVALCILFAGASLVVTLTSSPKSPVRAMAGFWLASPVVFASIIFMLAYLFGMPLFYGGAFIPPALSTSIALVALGSALIALAGLRAWAPDKHIDSASLRASLSFILVFVLMAAGLVTAGTIHFRNYAAHHRAEVERELSAIAELKVRELVNWRRERLGDATLLHRNVLFADLVRRAFANEQDTEAWKHLHDWLQQVREVYAYEEVYLMDLQGVARILIPGEASAADELVSVRRVLQTGEVTLEDFHRDVPGGAPHLSLLVPIPDDANVGEFLGVVMFEIDPARFLYPLIELWPTASPSAETMLVRREGNDVLYLNELRFRKGTALSLRYPLTRTDVPAVKAVLGNREIVEGTDYRGVPVIAAVRAVPGMPWFLLARIDTAEFMASIEQSLWLTATLVTAMLLASGATVGLIWRHQRVRYYEERSRAAEALAASAARYRAVSQSAADAIITANSAGAIVGWNAGAERIFGYNEAEVLGQPLIHLMPVRYREQHLVGFDRVRTGGNQRLIGNTIELHGLRKSGTEFPLELSLSDWQTSEGLFFTSIIRDVTERKLAQKALAHQQDLYSMLSQTNQAIVRMTSRDELFPAVCRTAVECGHFSFAWIGMLDSIGQQLKPVALAGEAAGYAQQMHISVDTSDPTGRGPAGTAFRTGEHVVSQDFLSDPESAPWRESADRAGVRSVGAFPIRQNASVVGVLVLAADEPGFFTEYITPTLNEMAVDISFALDNFERHAEILRMAEALRESESRFRGLVERSLIGMVIVDHEKVLYGNPRAAEILGCGQTEFQGRLLKTWISDADWPVVESDIKQLISAEIPVVSVEFKAQREDNTEVAIGAQGIRMLHDGKTAVLVVMQDISDKQRDEARIQHYISELEVAFTSTVSVATTLSEMRDPYTAGHERRVAAIAVAIGNALGFDSHRQEGLRVAGCLHDVGKITIPAEILTKPGKLTAIEIQLIQTHPQASYDVLKDVRFPWPVAQVALQHHERIDGTGYPKGLKGEAILIEARIMAVADVVEAMASHRPYRPGLGIDTALAEIQRGRGTLYDPGVVDACLRLFREEGFSIPAYS